jgi:hypothetical protein
MNSRTLTPTKLNNGWTQGILFNLWLGSTIVRLFQFQLPWLYPLSCYLNGESTSHCPDSHPSSSIIWILFEFMLSPLLREGEQKFPKFIHIRSSNVHPSSNFPLKELGHSQSSQGFSPIVQILIIHPLSPFIIERSWADQLPWVYVLWECKFFHLEDDKKKE